MNALKKINKFCGIIAVIAFLVTAFDLINVVRYEPNNIIFYISCSILLVFGVIFLITALIFILRDLIWHLRNKLFAVFIRHYLYTVAAIYILCLLIEYVMNGRIDWLGYLAQPFCIAILQIYFDGYKLNPAKHPAVQSA